ncbi:MAG: hypothetical protein DRR19_03660 [Candidatus Parabeggiatoa sp. nov. 1]|nr:MAG: hypothetical protein DRR19_03660 [Gammaproteobacteria bacterium]
MVLWVQPITGSSPQTRGTYYHNLLFLNQKNNKICLPRFLTLLIMPKISDIGFFSLSNGYIGPDGQKVLDIN